MRPKLLVITCCLFFAALYILSPSSSISDPDAAYVDNDRASIPFNSPTIAPTATIIFQPPEPPSEPHSDSTHTSQVASIPSTVPFDASQSPAVESSRGAPQQSTAGQLTRCTWYARNTFQPDTTSERAGELLPLVRWIDERCYRLRGYLYALTDGSYLGSFRHGGLIPRDNNIDLFLFLKDGQSRFDAQTELRPLLPPDWVLHDVTLMRRTISHKRFPPNRGFFALVDSKTNATANIEILTREKWQSSRLGPLCRCPFAPFETICFEEAAMFLKTAYGTSYRQPLSVRTERQDLLWFFQRR